MLLLAIEQTTTAQKAGAENDADTGPSLGPASQTEAESGPSPGPAFEEAGAETGPSPGPASEMLSWRNEVIESRVLLDRARSRPDTDQFEFFHRKLN